MKKSIFAILALSIATFLTACGGGDDSSTPTGPVISTLSFPLQSGVKAFTVSGYSGRFTVSGTCTGSGNMVRNPANTPATFEGKAGFSAISTINMTVAGCTPASQTQSATSYVDSNYISTGLISPVVKYGVYLTPPNIPLSVTVGATGVMGTLTHYTSSTKVTKDGRTDHSYVVEADTATTAIVNLIAKMYSAAGTLTVTEQDRYRITSTGALTPISSDVQYTNGVHLVITY